MDDFYQEGEKIAPKYHYEMGNRLEYYRPKGVRGNFKAILRLQHETSPLSNQEKKEKISAMPFPKALEEIIEVIYFQASSPSYSYFTRLFRFNRRYEYYSRYVEAVTEGEVVTYDLPPLKVRDIILVRIQDKDIALPQMSFFEVTEGGIRRFVPRDVRQLISWRDRSGKRITDEQEGHWDAIKKTEFKPIELVDLDAKR